MKIEINKVGSKKFYDEFLYVLMNHNKIKKNPRKKAKSGIFSLVTYIILALLTAVILAFWYFKNNDGIVAVLIGMNVILLILLSAYLVIIEKRIKMLMSQKDTKVIEINEEGIRYTDTQQDIIAKWEDISCIVANKYSVCVLPKSSLNAIISLSAEYKEYVVNSLKEQNKSELLVDNT